MGELTGCNLLNTKRDGRMPSEFTSEYHVHIIVREGEMQFSDGKQTHVSQKDDLVIWQMSNAIQEVTYSDVFEADFLIASGEFLSRFNPEMVWASKGFIFIRINPSFHLHEESLRLMNDDFSLFRSRLSLPDSPFKEEVIGRVMQIFSCAQGLFSARQGIFLLFFPFFISGAIIYAIIIPPRALYFNIVFGSFFKLFRFFKFCLRNTV